MCHLPHRHPTDNHRRNRSVGVSLDGLEQWKRIIRPTKYDGNRRVVSDHHCRSGREARATPGLPIGFGGRSSSPARFRPSDDPQAGGQRHRGISALVRCAAAVRRPTHRQSCPAPPIARGGHTRTAPASASEVRRSTRLPPGNHHGAGLCRTSFGLPCPPGDQQAGAPDPGCGG